jgi:hypothetical protein
MPALLPVLPPLLPRGLLCLAVLLAVTAARGDDTEKLRSLFTAVGDTGGTVTIPAGTYTLGGEQPIPLRSHTTVVAYGARFEFPPHLGPRAQRVMFAGENVRDLRWFGGHFSGHVFDPARAANPWEPNANTRAIVVTTTPGGTTANLTFRDISSADVAGAVITVAGAGTPGQESQVDVFADNISVENCTLERSGKFMWDYGYLWQITVWPEEHDAGERALAEKYFTHDRVRGPLRMAAGDDRVFFDNATPLPVSRLREGVDPARLTDTVCFFGDALPTNLIRGRQYFVVESTPEFIRVADAPGATPLRFVGSAGPRARLIANLFQASLALYAPTGSGPGKGGLDLVGCRKVTVRGCRLSALGDTMHIQKCHGVIFTGNHITGSRMGAFFLAEYCRDAVITGNTVDGTNGSRVVSVEKSCADVVITGNTFRNGGRGSWINQPRNFILTDNIFINNTTKCERDPRRGRRSHVTGDFEGHAELYFTTHEPAGRYGNVTVRGNTFVSGTHATHAITFASGGDSLLVLDNLFQGPVRTIVAAPGCTRVEIRDNVGAEVAGGSPPP